MLTNVQNNTINDTFKVVKKHKYMNILFTRFVEKKISSKTCKIAICNFRSTTLI